MQFQPHPKSSEFLALIRDAKSIVLTTHVNPDGDAIGSEVGLADWLHSLGKELRIINHSPTPHNYLFLSSDTAIEQFSEATHDALLKQADLILVLDVNDPDRTRSLSPYLTRAGANVAVIDHHLEPKDFASHYFLDTDSCSTGELLMRLIATAQQSLGGKMSANGANALYTAIMTDTGSFRFPRTDSEVFRMCAELIDLGADPVMCYDRVYNSAPAARLLLIREALNSLEYQYDRRMAIQTITQTQLALVGASEEDVDGFVQFPFQVEGIVLSALLLELKHGWKISVRSKGNISAAKLAQSFGGNGHFNAAGARIEEPHTPEAMRRIVSERAGELL